MIWIGTSGWVFPHWIGCFYPPELPERDWLSRYAGEFGTVEINRSFYRQPTREQFERWARQAAPFPGFFFAVKASRYLTHMKKLTDTGERITRLISCAEGLAERLGPLLYQLPPRWRANPARLQTFISALPGTHRHAFEFREPTWYGADVLRVLQERGCALVVAVGGAAPTPPDLPPVGPFSYIRFHHGRWGIGLSDDEVQFWAGRISALADQGRDVYVYFNNDPGCHALYDARRLRSLLRLP